MGIDVYHGTGNVVWEKIRAAGHTFAFCKATEGLTVIDANLAKNLEGMKHAGMIRGAYHCYKFGLDPIQQADHFVQAVTEAGYDMRTDLPLAMGLDDRKGAQFQGPVIVQRDTRLFLDRLEQETSKRPILYGDRPIIETFIGRGFGDHPLWLSHYADQLTPNELPSGWSDWTFWQYTQSGTVAGIQKSLVDLDRYNGDDAKLHAWIAGGRHMG